MDCRTGHSVHAMKLLGRLLVLQVISTFPFTSTLAQSAVEQWGRFEVTLPHSFSGNSFKAVDLSATFVGHDTSYVVSGFYDGNDTFKIRFMPQQSGRWNYTTASNVSELNEKTGSFECVKATGKNHGMVRVSETYHFRYDDGTQYYPFGTTAYAWTHMNHAVQETTLKALTSSGFNKVRMSVFPHGSVEPELFPFPAREVKRDSSGKENHAWDFERFNPAFFKQLEKRIDDLGKIGIEADLILFHPYDEKRWGFDVLPPEVNNRYVRYVTARLSAFRNIWWSMANEFDYVRTRSREEWDLLSKTVVETDPYGHLCSIHGSTAHYYEYWKPEFTHASIQDEAPVMDFGHATLLRNAYAKPVIYDEVCYEGDLDRRWGRLSGEEMSYFVWMGVLGGTYVTHGESYKPSNDEATLFIRDGGKFRGKSWQRIAFLRKLLEEGPGPLEIADVGRDHRTAIAGKGYYLVYFGKKMKDSWLFNLPVKSGRFAGAKPGTRFKVEIIDTWEMTIETCPVTFEVSRPNDYRLHDKNFNKVRLPLKPYQALRITEIP